MMLLQWCCRTTLGEERAAGEVVDAVLTVLEV